MWWAVGLLELSLGNPAAAARAGEPLAQLAEAGGAVPAQLSTALPDEIEALIALGELRRAERLLEILEANGRSSGLAWPLATAARCRGLLLAAQGESDGALRALEEALAHHAGLEMPLERARTLLVRGQVQRRQRRKRAASDSLAETLELFERSGAALWAKRAREELGRVGVRPRRPAGPDRRRAAGRRARRQRPDQPGGRRGRLHEPQDRGGQPHAHLPQARDPLRAELGVRLAERNGAQGDQRNGA